MRDRSSLVTCSIQILEALSVRFGFVVLPIGSNSLSTALEPLSPARILHTNLPMSYRAQSPFKHHVRPIMPSPRSLPMESVRRTGLPTIPWSVTDKSNREGASWYPESFRPIHSGPELQPTVKRWKYCDVHCVAGARANEPPCRLPVASLLYAISASRETAHRRAHETSSY